MENKEDKRRSYGRRLRLPAEKDGRPSVKKQKRLHLIITVALIFGGVAGFIIINAQKAELKKQRSDTPAPMVQSIKVKTVSQPIFIDGEGTVRPLREIRLVPQVGGKVIFISPALVNGGEFQRGDTLLKIDPDDYRIAVTLARAKLKDAESVMKQIREESLVAREEWREHYAENPNTGEKPPALVVKEPQLAAAQATLAAKRADLRKAILNLERTELKAPFDGRVSEKSVDIGQYVTVGQALATLFSTEAAEIVIPLEDKDLYWFHVPGFTPGEGPGADVKITARMAGREQIFNGRVVRAEGKLSEQTRLVKVVVRVENPYAQKPPLAIGLFVSARIQGRQLDHAALIPRAALHADNIVWVVENPSTLKFRSVEVAYYAVDGVMISKGLNDGDQIVISPLKAVSDGMKIRNVNMDKDSES
jgi:RND family efflux transporter MFP subunit